MLPGLAHVHVQHAAMFIGFSYPRFNGRANVIIATYRQQDLTVAIT
jgi:hypothetical protein